MVHQDRAENALGFGQDVLQRLLDVLLGVGQRDHTDRRTLPDVVEVQLGDRYVEFAAQTILETAQNLTLVLEGARVRDMQFERQQTDGHSG